MSELEKIPPPRVSNAVNVTAEPERIICESCGVLWTRHSAWCDCTKAGLDTQRLRPLTVEEEQWLCDEPCAER